jgi:hypothetical protein
VGGLVGAGVAVSVGTGLGEDGVSEAWGVSVGTGAWVGSGVAVGASVYVGVGASAVMVA